MLVRQGYRGSVGVVTPFRAQANKIRDLLHAHPQANLMLRNGECLWTRFTAFKATSAT